MKRILFYIVTFFSSMIVIPSTGGIGISLLFGGIVCPLAGCIKFIGKEMGYSIPISLFQIGSIKLPVGMEFVLSIVAGIVLYYFGYKLWSICKKYIAWLKRGWNHGTTRICMFSSVLRK
ncbi:MAG: hypothetical protein Q4C49_06705 [Bacillota bacterium]|nr:hypothetical protein [Bacillota bacterium]